MNTTIQTQLHYSNLDKLQISL